MDQGQSAILATGQTLSLPFCLVLCAEVARRVGQVAEGLDWLAEAIKMLETSKRATCWPRHIGSRANCYYASKLLMRSKQKTASDRP